VGFVLCSSSLRLFLYSYEPDVIQVLLMTNERRVWRYQRGNQNPYIEEQTTQWPKEKVQKDKQRSTQSLPIRIKITIEIQFLINQVFEIKKKVWRYTVMSCTLNLISTFFLLSLGRYLFWKEEFEDIKGAIRIRISKNRQHNGQKKKYKRTNNDLQNIPIKLKIKQHEPH
jgi:Holliday junction resolvase RusA-like endonuclease